MKKKCYNKFNNCSTCMQKFSLSLVNEIMSSILTTLHKSHNNQQENLHQLLIDLHTLSFLCSQ